MKWGWKGGRGWGVGGGVTENNYTAASRISVDRPTTTQSFRIKKADALLITDRVMIDQLIVEWVKGSASLAMLQQGRD